MWSVPLTNGMTSQAVGALCADTRSVLSTTFNSRRAASQIMPSPAAVFSFRRGILYQSAKTAFQSFLTLATVQPVFFAVSSAFSAPAVYAISRVSSS